MKTVVTRVLSSLKSGKVQVQLEEQHESDREMRLTDLRDRKKNLELNELIELSVIAPLE
jgi:hypothetical protein